MDLIKELIGEYTLLTVVLIVLSVFLNRFMPPIREQWKFLIIASTGMVLAFLAPPNDWQSILYGWCIAGLVVYKNVLIEELKIVITAAKHVNEEKAAKTNKESEE